MSLSSAMDVGVTGLNANSTDLETIGDNIANSGTIGFKEGRAAFENAMAQSLIGGEGQLGLGAELQTVQKILTQGSLQTTGNATDMAIQGNGMFVVKGTQDGVTGQFYTRDGQFTIDKTGNLVNLSGLDVQGFLADSAGNITGQMGNLPVGTATSQPSATANVTLKANLDANAPVIAAAWDPLQAQSTSNFSTTTTVYDSLGNSHQVQIYFRKTAAGGWDWHALTDGGGLAGGTAGTPTEIANGTMTFDTSGKLSAFTQTSNFNPVGSVNPQALNFNFGDPTGAGGTGLAGVTQFAGTSAATFVNQDGFGSGTLSNMSVDANGVVTGAFSNGQTRALGQLALASFQAPDQLQRVGGNLYLQTQPSGQPTLGGAGSGGRGSITEGALEQSNVNMSNELVAMIAAQRDFQANSKTISAADQMLQQLLTTVSQG